MADYGNHLHYPDGSNYYSGPIEDVPAEETYHQNQEYNQQSHPYEAGPIASTSSAMQSGGYENGFEPVANKTRRKRKSKAGGQSGESESDDYGDSIGSKEPKSKKRVTKVEEKADLITKKKRAKSSRACDSCRKKKIRCDAVPELDPPICVHCKSHGLECTWFLPITETRFHRKKPIKDGIPTTKATSAPHRPRAPLPPPTIDTHSLPPPILQLPVQLPRPILSISPPLYPIPAIQPHYSMYNNISQHHLGPGRSARSSPNESSVGTPNRREPRLIGPTSISHLMHSTSTFPTDRMGPVDFKYAQTLTVGETGDGYIKVVSDGDGGNDDYIGSEGGPAIQGIEKGTAEKLLNYFFRYHSPHFPIVSRADFLSAVTPSPLLFNALCGISALSHHVPPSILRTIKGTIRTLIREDDILDNSSISNVQALLIYAYSLELEKGVGASKTWNVLGVAIRMAQDMGLHRKMTSSTQNKQSDTDHDELRRRVWGGCLIADRWISAIYGSPMMIDLQDCDCLLPSIYDIRPNLEFDAEQRPYLFNSALISLSILLGRILKLVYSPTGIMTLSSADADQLIADLGLWVTGLPEELKFSDPANSGPAAGFLHLLYIPVRFLVTRPFMRISFQLPERFSHISVGIEQWSQLEGEARDAIEWVDKNESCLEGWFVGIYAFFICSLVQYHSHIRRRDARSLATLELARNTMRRLVVPDGECHVRAKIAEITHLLYETAISVSKWAPEAAEGLSPATPGTNCITTLNPTVGVRQREQDWNMKYRAEGKGYFVTDRVASPHDPPDLIRSTASPASSNNASPYANTLPYSSSLRTTHLPEVEPEEPIIKLEPIPSPLVNNNSLPIFSENRFLPSISASHSPSGSTPLGMNGAISSMNGNYSDFESSLNFNPTLNNNLNGSNGFQGTYPAPGFDGFGFGAEATPEGLFDWDQWSSFFQNTNGTPNGSHLPM